MTNKERLIKLIEVYLNEIKSDVVFESYGKGSTIKVKNINFGITKNYILIEAKVILGEVITEDILDESFARILIEDSMLYIYPDSEIRTYITFDS